MLLDARVKPFSQRSPDRVAVRDGDGAVLTYGELDRLANRFAHAFLASGLAPGDRVGVHVPRSGRTIAAMIGALRAGGVYVPLDVGSPPARVRLIARDCGIRHVVISPRLLATWAGTEALDPVEHFFLSAEGAAPCVDGPRVHAWSEVLGASDVEPDRREDGSPDRLAYLLYTSGSTGIPKGVMLSHRNALAFVDWATELIGLGPDDHVASVAPFHFDLSVFDIWGSLSRGATIVIVDEATVLSGRAMLDRIRSAAISVWYSVPSAIVLMLESGGLEKGGASSLRNVFFAGEVFPMKHLRRAMAALPQARFFNLFGPTETNVCVACQVPPQAQDASAIPIGIASCGNVAMILDSARNPVPDGETGELFIEGPTVMLGYWDAGRRAPAPHPYPTGDLVSRRADGQLMYHGRRDHMVKIHGFRIELGEVEAALMTHPGIQEAVAFAADQSLVVVAVPSDPAVSVLEVKRFCASRLPRYMVPGDVRLVGALPKTSSGKTDRVRVKAAVSAGDSRELKPVGRPGA
jgi:amino acid adenylation domain-containing protein